ncbi:MAG TPA: diaminopimelate epimerase [Elusimicrobiota bacterium]|nr:diaminopimelate epimerase [Elusimicrobiota bacterium]
MTGDKELIFTKMHGAGNDFVVLDAVRKKTVLTPSQCRFLCDRRFGVGADQILIVSRSTRADYRMTIMNADGSQAEMCGNGIRCVARFVRQRGYASRKDVSFETLAGLIKTTWEGTRVSVDMGIPVLEAAEIPTKATGRVVNRLLTVGKVRIPITCVSMGNPHCVIFVDDVWKTPVEDWGPAIENHPFFPRRVNVEFVSVKTPSQADVRVWERGAGLTLACGTGACAVGVAGVLTGRFHRAVTLKLPGGRLGVEWKADDHVILTGPAAFVYEGRIRLG